MRKTIRLLNYRDEPKKFIINDFEKVQIMKFCIISGDCILELVYPNKIICLDSDHNRFVDFNDFDIWLSSKDINLINKMKTHGDYDNLIDRGLPYEFK